MQENDLLGIEKLQFPEEILSPEVEVMRDLFGSLKGKRDLTLWEEVCNLGLDSFSEIDMVLKADLEEAIIERDEFL